MKNILTTLCLFASFGLEAQRYCDMPKMNTATQTDTDFIAIEPASCSGGLKVITLDSLFNWAQEHGWGGGGGSLMATQVGYGSSSNTLTGNGSYIYNYAMGSGNNYFQVGFPGGFGGDTTGVYILLQGDNGPFNPTGIEIGNAGGVILNGGNSYAGNLLQLGTGYGGVVAGFNKLPSGAGGNSSYFVNDGSNIWLENVYDPASSTNVATIGDLYGAYDNDYIQVDNYNDHILLNSNDIKLSNNASGYAHIYLSGTGIFANDTINTYVGGTILNSQNVIAGANITVAYDASIGGGIRISGASLSGYIPFSDTNTLITTRRQLAIFAGTTNITTLGTIGTGVWNGTAIAKQYLNDSILISGTSITISRGSSGITINSTASGTNDTVLKAGNGISISRSGTGNTITNTLPDTALVVSTGLSIARTGAKNTLTNTKPDTGLSVSTGLSINRTLNQNTLTNTKPDTGLGVGLGISISRSLTQNTITNTKPDTGLIAGTNITITRNINGNTINASGGGGSGTVTSVATGYGLTGGTITTSGTLKLDTTVGNTNGSRPATENWTYKNFWNTAGNAGTTVGTNFLGTSDSTAFEIKVNNYISGYVGLQKFGTVFLGAKAGFNNTGVSNVYIGKLAGYTGVNTSRNIAIGTFAGGLNTGESNFFGGDSAGRSQTTGNTNIFIGDRAGDAITTGTNNICLNKNSGSAFNVSNCVFEGVSDGGTGNQCVAIGGEGVIQNSNGSGMTAVGDKSVRGGGNFMTVFGFNNVQNETGVPGYQSDIIVGANGVNNLTKGTGDIFMGMSEAQSTTNAIGCTIISNYGVNSATGDYITTLGDSIAPNLTSGTQDTYLGANIIAGSATVNNETVLGYGATGNGSNTITLGNSSVTFVETNGAYIGKSSAPSITAGAGAGSGVLSPVVSDTGTGSGWATVVVTTGTTTTTGIICTITFPNAFPNGSVVTYSPGNQLTALLSGATMIYFSSSKTQINLNSGTSALTGAGTTYVWHIHWMGY